MKAMISISIMRAGEKKNIARDFGMWFDKGSATMLFGPIMEDAMICCGS